MQISRYRAAEHRKPLVRSTSTGVSALIDKFGNIVESIELDNEKKVILNSRELKDVVISRSGHTPFVVIGKWPFIFLILIIIFGSFMTKIFRK